jgi:hypothetical protein
MNETPKTDPNAAPAPETVDHTKQAEKLWAADAERHKNQGSKEEGGAKGDEATDYDSLTVPELKDLAHKRGLQISSDMRKDEIIAALEKGT